MRLIPLEHLKEDSMVAVNVINQAGVPLVCAGEKLTQKNLDKLQELKLSYVYIHDRYCIYDNPPHYTISRISDFYSTIKVLHTIAEKIADNTATRGDIFKIKQIASKLVDELLKIPEPDGLKIIHEPVKLYNYMLVEQSIYVSIMAVILGFKLKLRHAQLIELCVTALVRNFCLISDSVSFENELYEGQELEKMHPILSHVFLSRYEDFSINVLEGVLHHHEYHNGAGYPNGIEGDDIHIYAKIIGLVNFFYKIKNDNDPTIVRHGILDVVFKSKLRQFDPAIVDVFLENVEMFSLDTILSLTTGDYAIVIKNNPSAPFRPIVKIIRSVNFPITTNIDLSKEEYNYIKINTVSHYLD